MVKNDFVQLAECMWDVSNSRDLAVRLFFFPLFFRYSEQKIPHLNMYTLKQRHSRKQILKRAVDET